MMEEFKLPGRSVPLWRSISDLTPLTPNSIHVWRSYLDLSSPIVNDLHQLLSLEEKVKADRIRFDIHRRRFTVARASLRIALGKYIGADPARIEIRYGDHGKPYLLGEQIDSAQLKFNVAHSHSWGLYAFAAGREVGIDLERISERPMRDEIALRFFSPGEIKSLGELPPSMRRRAFFNCWTRKEAFLKAKGLGLTLPLDQFEVTVEASAAILRTSWDEAEARRWSLQTINLGSDYVGAIAVEGKNSRIRCWQIDPDFFNQTN